MTKKKLDYDPKEFIEDFDAAHKATFLAAIDLADLKDRDFYVTMDGTSRPFYGKAYKYGKNAPPVDPEDLSTAASWTEPAFKRIKRKTQSYTQPEYAGTTAKHPYFMMNSHLYDSMESIPLAVRRGKVTARRIEDFIKVLDGLPIKPAFLFADKEFCNDPKTRELRKWCDANKVAMMLPFPKNSAVQRIVQEDWNDGTAKLVKGASQLMYWSMRRRSWDKKGALPYNLLNLYFEGDPRKDLSDEGHEIMRLPNGMFCVCFYTNVTVTAKNVLWLSRQYSFRWACENLHKRWKALCGRSGAPTMFMRDLVYEASMLMLAGYALWRIEKMRSEGLELHDKKLSIVSYFGTLRHECTRKIWSPYFDLVPRPPRPPSMPKPPAPPAPPAPPRLEAPPVPASA